MNLCVTNNSRYDEQEKNILKICDFFQIDKPELTETEYIKQIKEICVIRICKAIGIKNMYNRHNRFFDFYSDAMGQAVSDILNLSLKIAPDNLRLFRYDGINFVNRCKDFLQNSNMDEAMIDAFNLIDDNKDIVEKVING